VPLIIKYPNQQSPERNTENVELIDVLPTICDVLGADVDWTFEGRSLIDPEARPRPTKRLPPNVRRSGTYEYAEAEYLKWREEAHRRIIETFSLDDPRSDIFHYGKGLDFIGKELSAVDGLRVEGTVDSPDAERFADGDGFDAGPVHTAIRGTVALSGPRGADLHVAVAVNGRIELVCPVYASGAKLHFEAILSDELFGGQPQDVELALLDLRATF
jgi:hypothetical protein